MGGIFALTGVLALAGDRRGDDRRGAVGRPLARRAPSPASRTTLVEVALEPDLLRLNFGIFVLHCVQMAMFVVVPRWLVERGGLPLGDHWKLYLPVVLLSFALMMPPLIWGERHGHMRRCSSSAVALLAAVAAVRSARQPAGLVPLAALLLAFFVGFNILEASLPSLVSRMAPPGREGGGAGHLQHHAGARAVLRAARSGAGCCPAGAGGMVFADVRTRCWWYGWRLPSASATGRGARRAGWLARSGTAGNAMHLADDPSTEEIMASVNKVILSAISAATPRRAMRPAAAPSATCRIATTRNWKDKATGEKREETEWHRVVFYDRLAEIAGEYLKKGRPVYVEGRLKTRKWQDKDGQDKYTTEIIADEMQMLGSREGGGGGGGGGGFGDEGGYSARAGGRRGRCAAAARGAGGGGGAGGRAPARKPAAAPADFDNMDDDIPF